MKKATLMLTIISLVLTLTLSLKTFWSSAGVANVRNFPVEYKLPSLAPMLERVIPAVVSVSVEGSTIVNAPQDSDTFNSASHNHSSLCNQNSSLNNLYLSNNFFQKDSSRIEQFRALGSGVIVDSNRGYVITNNHVVNRANKIQVQLHDGRKYHAIVIGKDARSDVALIQLQNASKLIAINMANSDTLRVGDYTAAIGNPYGLGETVTYGIVSAVGRSDLNIEHYENFIQTDAAINRGNSGGALVNLKGELVGMNTAILTADGGNIGLGFAIPSNMIKSLTKQMVSFGKIKRGELGIIGAELNSELSRVMNLSIQKGAFISQVLPDSTAEKAGIKAGDVIIFLNDKPIYSFSTLRVELSSMPINTKITLGVLRNSHVKKYTMQIQNRMKEIVDSANVNIGIEGAELSNYDFHGHKGVLVNAIKSDTSAFSLGLRKNDIILGVNQTPISNMDDLRKSLSMKSSILVFNVKRGNSILYLLLQ